MNGSSSWIEPPPAQRGLGCFAKGCLILVVFFILLALAFVAGTYYAAKYLRTEYFSIHHERAPLLTLLSGSRRQRPRLRNLAAGETRADLTTKPRLTVN